MRKRRALVFAGLYVGVIGAIALAGLALIPLAISQQGTGNSDWIAKIPLNVRLSQVVPQFLLGFGAPAGRWLRAIDAIVVLVAVALLWWRGGQRERRAALLAGGLAAAGAVVMLVLVAVGVDDQITRNIVVLWLPLVLIVAAGLGSKRAGIAGLACVAVLCATGVVAAVGVAVERSLERPDWRPLARALGPPPADVGRAILIQHYKTLLPLSLYQPRLKFIRRGRALVDELDVIGIRSPQQAACWWGAACNLIPSQMQLSYPVPGFHIVGERQILQFTLLELRSTKPVYLTRQLVSRALSTTELRNDGLILQSPGAAR